MKRRVAILIFEDAEVLDFAGPFEVFSVASELHGDALFDVQPVASTPAPLRAVNGMVVLPNATFAEASAPDILVIVGGAGTRRAMTDPNLLDWVEKTATQAEVVMSVCSGTRILAVLGMLDDLEITTHHQVVEHVAELAPKAKLRRGERFVDTGRIVTTGGISAGIDGSFHLVARLAGADVAKATAAYMEYRWVPERTYRTTGA